MTRMGVILGTAAYMSPEQARGKPVDKRSDIWAFGCVLYEMLTGRRAFEGEDISDTLANVLKIDPDWQALPAEIPAAIRALLRRCLDKDRRTRVADISTALFVLDEAAGLRGRSKVRLKSDPRTRGGVALAPRGSSGGRADRRRCHRRRSGVVEHEDRVAGRRPYDNRNDGVDRTGNDGVASVMSLSRLTAPASCIAAPTNCSYGCSIRSSPTCSAVSARPRIRSSLPTDSGSGLPTDRDSRKWRSRAGHLARLLPWTAFCVAPRGDRTGPLSSRPTRR